MGEPPPPSWRTDERSNEPTSGWCTIRCSKVAVYPHAVTRSRSTRRSTAVASKRPIGHTERVPLALHETAALRRPETWNRGLVTSTHAGGAPCRGGEARWLRAPWNVLASTSARTFRCECTTPLGRPVVPLV